MRMVASHLGDPSLFKLKTPLFQTPDQRGRADQ
jgi:hypothetical protein